MSNKKEKYTAFISYRRTSSVNADFIKKSLIEKGSYDDSDIFLDRHNIGPELYDDKLRNSVIGSNVLIILVTKDCFLKKEDDEDWFLEEIKTAINNKN